MCKAPVQIGEKKEIKPGDVFDRLTVVRFAGTNKYRTKTWECLCACGNIRIVRGTELRSGRQKSCGCHRTEIFIARNTEHGHTSRAKTSPTYTSWKKMIARCTNKNYYQYKNYGGRGITVCEEWRDFTVFLRDMGERPKGKELDRIDNDLGYSVSNCRWATHTQNNRNKRNNRLVTYKGETRCAREWAEKLGIDYHTLQYRLNKWSVKDAFERPVQSKYRGSCRHE